MWLEDVKCHSELKAVIYKWGLSVCAFVCVCVHVEARTIQRGEVNEVQPADTEVCVFSNEIYWAPDVPSYEDVCRRFRRVRPAPCQSRSGVLFYCLLPSSPPPNTITTTHRWPLNLTTTTPLLFHTHIHKHTLLLLTTTRMNIL